MNPITNCHIVIPLSGRKNCWKLLRRFLERQIRPHNNVTLTLIDASGNPDFRKKLLIWAQETPFADTTTVLLLPGSQPGLADQPRHKVFAKVNQEMVRIYSLLQSQIAEGGPQQDQLLWIIEDDIIPPDNAFPKLLSGLDAHETVFCVSGAYQVRGHGRWVCWRDLDQELVTSPGQGKEIIQGTGFGCLLMESRNFLKVPLQWQPRPTPNPAWPWGYDMEFFRTIKAQGLGDVLMHWDVVCTHLQE